MNIVQKRVLFGLISVCLGTLCSLWIMPSIFIHIFKPFPIKTGHHISPLTMQMDDLYFGAGHCLYQLDINTQRLHPIICDSNLTFQRPVIGENNQLYATTVAWLYGSSKLASVDKSTGELNWHRDVSGYDGAWYRLRDYITVIDGRVYAPYRQGFSIFEGFSGELLWESDFNYMKSLLIHDGSIWYPILTEKENEQDGVLVAIDIKTGTTKQIIDVRPDAWFDDLFYMDKQWAIGIYNQANNSKIIAVNLTTMDQIAWEMEVNQRFFTVRNVYNYDGTLLINGSDNKVLGLEIKTGELLWSFDAIINPKPKTVTTTGKIAPFLLSDWHQNNALYGFDGKQGNLAWIYPIDYDGYIPEPLITDNIVYLGYKDRIQAIDIQTGTLLWEVEVDSEYERYDGGLYTQ